MTTTTQTQELQNLYELLLTTNIDNYWIAYYTSKNYLSYQNIFDHNYIQKIVKEHKSGNKRYEKFLWSFLIFQDWYSENKLSI